MFLTVIIFILVLGLLVFVHEFGHFITAKKAGAKVEEFGFGFPPRIFSIKKGETIYSINLFPIGGFVKIYGENGEGKEEEKKDKARAFYNFPLKIRALILSAGVLMNLFLAIFLLSVGHFVGLPTAIEDAASGNFKDLKVQIAQVVPGLPADEAGLRIGDQIISFTSDSSVIGVAEISQVQNFTSRHRGEEIVVLIGRGNEVLEKSITLLSEPPQAGEFLGVALVQTAIISQPWYRAIISGLADSFSLLWLICYTLGLIIWQLITTGRAMIEGGGPVYIFNLTGQAAQLGFVYVLQLTAILSINLAIINILPFPALDGGRLIFLALEKIKGSPVSQKVEGLSHTLGFVFLILLMVAITWHDIVKLF